VKRIRADQGKYAHRAAKKYGDMGVYFKLGGKPRSIE
jgi:hypothetical protein